MKKKLSLIALTLSLSTASYAQIFKLNADVSGLPAGVQEAALSAIQNIENDLNKDLPSAPPQRLMEGMADSSAIAGKGIGSDYASGMQVMLIGAGVGVGADLEKDKTTDSDLSGVGVQPAIIIGANLGFMDAQSILGMDTDKLNVYISGMSYNLDRKLGKDNKDEINAKLTSLGIHFSYDWIKPSGSKLFGWGGVKFHTGYEYSSAKYKFTTRINETVNSDVGGGATIDGNLTGTPEASIDVTTHSIPFEISSSVQFLYLFSLYGGLGADYNMGEAKGAGSINANSSTLTCNGGPCAGESATVAPTANIDGKGKVTAFWARAFAGVQLNLPYTRIFVQANKVFGNEVVGATAGLRFVY
jgi:hypothetical protein